MRKNYSNLGLLSRVGSQGLGIVLLKHQLGKFLTLSRVRSSFLDISAAVEIPSTLKIDANLFEYIQVN